MSRSAENTFLPWYAHWAEHQPAAVALVTANTTLSYGELHEQIIATGEQLLAAGATPGIRLVLDSNPVDENWIITLLAALYAGAQVILPDTAWSTSERQTILGRMQPAYRLEPKGSLQKLAPCLPAASSAESGIWLFTSGTTDTPQAHFRSLELTLAMVQRVLERLPTEIVRARPAALAVAPLYHGYGLVNCLLLPHAFGGSVVLSESGEARHLADLLIRHCVQVIYGWPAHFKLLANSDISPLLLHAPLRWCVSSSSKLDAETARAFLDASGCPLRQQYGMTETGPLSLDSETDAANDPSCIGRPFNGVEISVLNEHHEPLVAGESGMLAVRFTSAFACPPHLTPGQFWTTGDIGKIDSQGRVYLLSRATPFTDERKEA